MKLVFYQPEIPQNIGTLLRLAVCLNLEVDLIEPLGFVLTDRRFQRAGMDYLTQARINRHISWPSFKEKLPESQRLLALVPGVPTPYFNFSFQPCDHILVGSESKGLPQDIQDQATACLAIPMVEGKRSLNVALAATLVVGEALRQTNLFPKCH